MSFGFSGIVSEIENAVIDMNRIRRENNMGEVLFFAAANNEGANYKELFPASLETVISVRGTDHVGSFVKKYNPPPWSQKGGAFLFGTLGQDVPYDFGDTTACKSGCSVATPILAGIAALIIQYANYITGRDLTMMTKLRSKEGISQVLYYTSEGDSDRCRYVRPWEFFERKDEERIATIRHALATIEHRL